MKKSRIIPLPFQESRHSIDAVIGIMRYGIRGFQGWNGAVHHDGRIVDGRGIESGAGCPADGFESD